MFLGSRALPVRRADNLIVICEPIVWQCGILNFSQPYRPPRCVTGIDMCLPLLPVLVIKKKFRGLSPQADYTDRTTAACQRS
jgi:hypothetical protein